MSAVAPDPRVILGVPATGEQVTRRAWRLVAALPVTVIAALQWGALVRPGGAGSMMAALLIGAALGWGLLELEARTSGRTRAHWCAAAVLGGLVGAALCAGVPVRDLLPDRWDVLATGISDGVASIPDLLVPYRGPEVWTRRTILLGGTALTIAVLLLACWPAGKRTTALRWAAATAVGVLYVAAVIPHTPSLPFLSGSLFALAFLGFVRAERIPQEQWRAGVALAAGALLIAVVLAPRLDGSRPWIDLQHLSENADRTHAETFSWNHRYGPLDWPRTGRQMLTVSASTPDYWKAATLDEFDGKVWREDAGNIFRVPDTELDRTHPEWFQRIAVQVHGLRSDRYIGAGTLLSIADSSTTAVPAGPGVFEPSGAPLRAGDSYVANVYLPRPTPAELSAAGVDYPDQVGADLLIDLPRAAGGPSVIDSSSGRRVDARATIAIGTFGDPGSPVAIMPGAGGNVRIGGRLLLASDYGRMYRLARRLRAASSTPYAFLRAVQSRVQQGAVYSETPGVHRNPLDAFLFDDRQGYCQQFSGAMALLLRMGGVPARVAAGFAPGTPLGHGRYSVRDSDAHSWVEAYFPRIGWVTFDPTPSASPARSQAGDRPGDGAGGARAQKPATTRPAVGADEGVHWPALFGLLAAGALLVLTVAVVLRARRRRRAHRPHADPMLEELQRALRRSGREPARATTLQRLESALGSSAGAGSYVRAVRDARFAGTGGGPTRSDRRALRAALAHGLGLRGRVRAWWAVPPAFGDRPRRAAS